MTVMSYKFYRQDTQILVEASTYSEARRKFFRRKGFFPDSTWECTAIKYEEDAA